MADLRREELIADRSLVGAAFCQAYARCVDQWLQQLFAERLGDRQGLSLIALGGYGRSLLSPNSDLDLLLLHDGWNQDDLGDAAQLMWFPIWDAHLDLGHSVRSVQENLDLANSDLDTATSLLGMRLLAGDGELAHDLAQQSRRAWRQNDRKWLPQLIENSADRANTAGEVAFLLEPDLKNSHGGLRDVDTVGWIEAAGIDVLTQERRDLEAARDVLLAARVELHRSTGRKGDRLLLEEQDAVAEMLGAGDADELMSDVAASARTVTWISDDVFSRVNGRTKRFQRLRPARAKAVAASVELTDGVVRLIDDAPVADDHTLLLQLASAAAEHNARIDRDSLDRLVAQAPPIPTPWAADVRSLFVQLLRTGARAIPVVETLDHVGLFVRLLPEWEPTRSKVQRNQYHRFTVDRHLLEACANAVELEHSVDRPDLLVIAALLHDIGKGYPGDHTDVGVELIDTIAPRMGFEASDVDLLKRLCEHHLLLADAATRRDIEDEGTIAAVAREVRDTDFLWLLAALTEADSIATGPSAWSSWKAHLIRELCGSVARWLTDGSTSIDRSFPNDEQRALLRNAEQIVIAEGNTLTVVAGDRLGLFARIAGALALCNLNITGAETHVENGWALDIARVVNVDDPDEPIDWPRAITMVEEILATDDDLRPLFAARVASRLIRPRIAPTRIEPPRVDFDNDISADATVVEVAGPDRLGLLYEVAAAIAAAGLDSHRAHIQTVGDDVVDSFYVRTLAGTKLTDPHAQHELRERLLQILKAANVNE